MDLGDGAKAFSLVHLLFPDVSRAILSRLSSLTFEETILRRSKLDSLGVTRTACTKTGLVSCEMAVPGVVRLVSTS